MGALSLQYRKVRHTYHIALNVVIPGPIRKLGLADGAVVHEV